MTIDKSLQEAGMEPVLGSRPSGRVKGVFFLMMTLPGSGLRRKLTFKGCTDSF